MAKHAARFFEEPRAAKVPEITALFWAIKILTTAGGEATSDYLSLHNKVVGGAIEIVIFLIALTLQFRVRRYIAPYYWFLAYSIAIAGTGVADTMHLTIGLPYFGDHCLLGVGAGAHFLVLATQRGNTFDSQCRHSTPRD